VADVLRMAAFELGDPVQVFILLKADDFSWRPLRMRGLVHGLLILGTGRDGGNKANDLCGLCVGGVWTGGVKKEREAGQVFLPLHTIGLTEGGQSFMLLPVYFQVAREKFPRNDEEVRVGYLFAISTMQARLAGRTVIRMRRGLFRIGTVRRATL
jgi:hypothetical protein